MTAVFTTTELAGGSILVEGEDSRGTQGQQVITPVVWNELKAKQEVESAVALVDDAIAALVRPITEAVEQANAKLARPGLDPLAYVVEQDEVAHVHGQSQQLRRLDPDSIIIRALEEGAEDRLIWVNGKLTLTAAPAQP